jgi:hypothetical protein
MRIRPLALALLPALALAGPALAADATDDAVAVVTTFNEAISNRQLETLLGLFAPGAVQYALRPAHAGMPAPEKITSDLTVHWRTIGPVLFSVTDLYTRTPEIIDTRVSTELATVWARITTRSRDRNATDERSETFSEVYLLVNKGYGWKIGGIAENRGTDDLVID